MKKTAKGVLNVTFVLAIAISSVSLFNGAVEAGQAKIGNTFYTNKKFVNINLSVQDSGVGITNDSRMIFSNNGSTWSPLEKFSETKTNWDITSSNTGGTSTEDTKTIYSKVSDGVGNWMVTPMTLSLVYDITDPRVVGMSPKPNKTSVAPDTIVTIIIKDNLAGIDKESLVLKVGGEVTSPEITEGSNELIVKYTPPTHFLYGKRINVSVYCEDKVGNAVNESYSFFTKSDNGNNGTVFSKILPWGDSKNWKGLNPELWKVSSESNDDVYELEEHSFGASEILFFENFNEDIADSVYEILDQGNLGGASRWSIKKGVLVQSSGIFDWSKERNGTIIYTTAGSNWRNYEFSVDLLSADNDGIGVIFRHQDNNNFYQFYMDKQRKSQVLRKIYNGKIETLYQASDEYEKNTIYHVSVTVEGAYISVHIDGKLFVKIEDTESPIVSGGIGLYTWANAGSYFDNITVLGLNDSQDYESSFSKTSSYLEKDILNQAGFEFSLYDNESYGNFTAEYEATSFGGDTFSVFRYRDSNNYYLVNFPVNNLNRDVDIYKMENGAISKISTYSKNVVTSLGESKKYTVTAIGDEIDISIDGEVVAKAVDSSFVEGKVGLGAFIHRATFDDFQVLKK